MPTVESLVAELGSSGYCRIFDSPVLWYRWPDSEGLNLELRELILRQRVADSIGVRATNIGGWHSKRNLHEVEQSCISEVVARFQAMAAVIISRTALDPSPFLVECWGNVNERGHSNSVHQHAGDGVVWSGYYVVDPGNDEIGGRTVLQAEMEPGKDDEPITPWAGLMVVFASTMLHRVEPYQGDDLRVTIAANFKTDWAKYFAMTWPSFS